MSADENEALPDDDPEGLVRPYALTGGRTHPKHQLNLVSMVRATLKTPRGHLDPEYSQTLRLCRQAVSVAEVAAKLKQPLQVAKVLLSDLIDVGAVTTRAPATSAEPADRKLLEALLDGLQQQER
jgi:Protein of unknown function (DUF742)